MKDALQYCVVCLAEYSAEDQPDWLVCGSFTICKWCVRAGRDERRIREAGQPTASGLTLSDAMKQIGDDPTYQEALHRPKI